MYRYNFLSDASTNLKNLLQEQNEAGLDGAQYNQWEPFEVLAAKTIYNAANATTPGATASVTGYVSNYQALKALPTAGIFNMAVVIVSGHTNANDGGGGIFTYFDSLATPDNGGTVLAPNSGIGRWIRQYDNEINILWFGAKGDGSTDDTAAIQAAISSAEANSIILFPPTSASYKITSQISIPVNGLSLIGEHSKISGANDTQYRKFLFLGRTGGAVRGLIFDGLYTSAATGLGSGTITVQNSSNITIENCEFNNIAQSGVYVVGTCSNILISGNIFYRNFCAVFSDDDTVNQPAKLKIVNNQFKTGLGTTSTNFSGAIKISGAGSASSSPGHVIANNTIASTGQMGIEIQTWVNDCVIEGNSVEGCAFGISVSACTRASVTGNTIKDPEYVAIEFASNTSHSSATGNTIYMTNPGDNNGIIIVSGANNISISGGTISGSGSSRGIYVASSNVTISGVSISGFGQSTYVHNSSNVCISGCQINITNCFSGFFLDCSDIDVTGINITGNKISGNSTNCVVMLYSPNSHAFKRISFTNNNCSGIGACPAGFFNDSSAGIKQLTCLGIRSYNNIGNGTGNYQLEPTLWGWNVDPSFTFLNGDWGYFYLDNSSIIADLGAGPGGNMTILLPNATNLNGYRITFVKKDGTGGVLTLDGYSSQTIAGSPTYAVNLANPRVTLECDGFNWNIISK